MAQTSVRIYKNSGFNAVNIPDSPALLDSLLNFTDCYAIDINQERFLPQIRISAPGGWAAVKDVDYVRVDNFYYFVDNIWMSSGDVAELTLTPDFITSAGGPAALTILDGVTDRVHVTDDSFGLYGADDPYLAPALDMYIETVSKSFLGNGVHTFVETTLDLGKMGTRASGTDPNLPMEAISAIDQDTSHADPDTGAQPYVVVPVIDYTEQSTTYYSGVGGLSVPLTSTKGQVIYELEGNSNDLYYNKGIALARALGVEESISGQYCIPSDFLSGGNLGNAGRKTTLTGRAGNNSVTLPFTYGTANNKRIFYGQYTPYFLTACGGSVRVQAEEIYHSGDTYPTVTYAADPRRLGKPYFRFRYLNGVDGANSLDFFRGAVGGKEWLSQPMVFTNRSGSRLDQINYANSRSMADMDARHTVENFRASSLESGVGLLANAGSDLLNRNPGGAISEAVNAGIAQYERNRSLSQYSEKYARQKAIDQQQLAIAQSVNVPDVKFPVTPDLFSEATGNGYIVSRVKYQTPDISRLDKILTAYGYKHSKVLEATDFTNRTYFNYVSGSITVGNLPNWWANGIAAQIGTGVRVWHVKPSPTYYASNPVRVVTP